MQQSETGVVVGPERRRARRHFGSSDGEEWIEAQRSVMNSNSTVPRTRAVGLSEEEQEVKANCRGASKLKLAAPTASCLAPATDSWPL